MAKEENGVWRTVGGRRIFIKDGQSLSEAMRESGKFNYDDEYDLGHGVYKKQEKEIDDRNKKNHRDAIAKENEERMKEFEKRMTEKYEKKSAKQENSKKDYDTYKNKLEEVLRGYADESELEDLEKKLNLTDKEYEEIDKIVDIEYRLEEYPDEVTKEEKEYLKSKSSTKNYEQEEKNSNFEKQVNEGYDKFHGKTDKEISDAKDKAEAEYKKAYMSIPEEERVRAYEEGKNWKDLVKEKEQSSKETQKKARWKYEGWGEDYHMESDETYSEISATYSKGSTTPTKKGDKLQYHRTDYNKKSDGDIDYSTGIERTFDSLEEAKKASFGTTRENIAYKKAFEEYKKKHPNSKITLSKFIDMSEK